MCFRNRNVDTVRKTDYTSRQFPSGSFRPGENMARRQFLAQLLGLPFLSLGAQAAEEPKKKSLKIMMKSAWGSDDPTKAPFPFHHVLALADPGRVAHICPL